MKKIPGRILLKSKIHKCVKNIEADGNFKKLITDILVRRAVQFNRTDAELNDDLKALELNLSSVRIGESTKKKDGSYALASYNRASNEIVISKDAFSESFETIYQIIAHEIFHVLFRNDNGVDKFEKTNNFLMLKSRVLEELVAEKGSFQLVYQINDKPDDYNENAYGYDDIAFILEFIEAAYGVSERALIKNSLNGRAQLERFLAKEIGEEEYETREFLDELEVGASLIFSELYKNSSVKAVYVKYDKEMAENIVSGINSMYEVCQTKIEDRARMADITDLQSARKFKDEIAISEKKIQNILNNRLKFFHEELDYDVIDLWEKQSEGNYAGEISKILHHIESIINDYSIVDDEVRLMLINSAIFGNENEELLKWISSKKKDDEEPYSISEDAIKQKKDKAIYTEGWNNKRICRYIKSIALQNDIDFEKIKHNPEAVVVYVEKTTESKLSTGQGLERYKINVAEQSTKLKSSQESGYANQKFDVDDEKNR